MDDSITYAKKYLEDLLSFFGLNTDVHASHDEDVIELSIPSTHMNGFLIGQNGVDFGEVARATIGQEPDRLKAVKCPDGR